MEAADVGLWSHGPAECFDCCHTWVAVWPLGSEALECPKCHGQNTDRDQAGEPQP